MSLPLDGNGTDDEAYAALDELRDDVVPATIDQVDGVETNVTGETAGTQDFNDADESANRRSCSRSSSSIAFVLLLVTFRSIVIPIKAIVLNLLSVGAAYGVHGAVFQYGWGESLLGFESTGSITVLAAAVHVRDPVRPVDGLPRVHPQPDPRGVSTAA